MCNTSFHGIMIGKYSYCIILVIEGHRQSQKVKIMTVSILTNTNITSFWCDFDWIIRLWHFFVYTMSGPRSKVIESKRENIIFSLSQVGLAMSKCLM